MTEKSSNVDVGISVSYKVILENPSRLRVSYWTTNDENKWGFDLGNINMKWF